MHSFEEAFELSILHADDVAIEDDVRAIVDRMHGKPNIVVLVARGEVTLTGVVPERWMQLEIEHAALHVSGVRSVVSRLHGRDQSDQHHTLHGH